MKHVGASLLVLALVVAGLSAVATPAAAAGPTVRVGDVQVTEGDVGNATVKVPVDLSEPSATVILVPYMVHASSDGTADAADARFKLGTVRFPAGVTSAVISVVVNGDSSAEADQHVSITLGNPTAGATLEDGEGSIDIVDDDANGVNPGVDANVGSASVQEADAGTHTVYVPVDLSRPAPSLVKLVFTIGCSTASFLTDVSAPKTGSVTFQMGQRSKVISFRVKADTTPEETEALIRNFAVATGTVTLTTSESNTTIVDDDGVPTQNDGTLTDCGHGLPGFARESLPTTTFDRGAIGDREPIDVSYDGSPTHAPGGIVNSQWASTSADGSAVVFESNADNLVPGDTNGISDVFVRDRRTDTTERVSVKDDGSQIEVADTGPVGAILVGNHAAISADGRYVAYMTSAPLTAADANTPVSTWYEMFDVYVYDRVTHSVDIASQTTSGAHGGAFWGDVSISAHGRYVAFTVFGGTALSPDSGPNGYFAFIRDRQRGTTTQLIEGLSLHPQISDDGSTVVIDAQKKPEAATLVAIDVATGNTDRIDVASDGTPAIESDYPSNFFKASVTPDGRYVAFQSWAWNLIPGVSGPQEPAAAYFSRHYVRDRLTGTTSMRPPQGNTSPGATLSIDAGARHLVVDRGGEIPQLWDLATDTYSQYGPPYVTYGDPLTWAQTNHSLSSDGHYLVYRTESGYAVGPVTSRLWVDRVG